MGLNTFLKSLFGDKSTRDMKLIQPVVEKIKAAYPEIKHLTTTHCAHVPKRYKDTYKTRRQSRKNRLKS